MKDTKIDKIIRYGAYAAGAYFLGITIAGAIKRKRAEGTNGIGYAQAYASKKRITPYFQHPKLIDEVLIDLTSRKGNYLDARIYFKYRMPLMFWISREDARWLSEMCDKYDVEFSAWNGNTYVPSLHKKIVYSLTENKPILPTI